MLNAPIRVFVFHRDQKIAASWARQFAPDAQVRLFSGASGDEIPAGADSSLYLIARSAGENLSGLDLLDRLLRRDPGAAALLLSDELESPRLLAVSPATTPAALPPPLRRFFPEAAEPTRWSRLAALVDSIPDLIAFATPAGEVIYFNQAALGALAAPASSPEAPRRTLLNLHPEWLHDLLSKDAIPAAIRDGSWSGETEWCGPGGEAIPVFEIVLAHRDTAGAIDALISIARDLRERKRLEAQLEARERIFNLFMTHSPFVSAMKDEQGRLVYVNRGFEQMTRKSAAELLGKDGSAYFSPEIWQELRRHDEQVIRTGKAQHFLETFPDPSGKRHSWWAYKFPIRDAQGALFLGVISVDMTERMNLEDQVRQSQKMEAIGALAEGLAHHLNNLLSIMLGRVELTMLQLGRDHPSRKGLVAVQQAGFKAADLVHDLLKLSNTRGMLGEPAVLDAVVTHMHNMLRPLLLESIEVQLDLRTNGRHVPLDSSQMEQVLLNLVLNAGEAMPEGGALQISTSPVRVGAAFVRDHPQMVPGEYSVLEVRDNGHGIPPEIIGRIFDPFFTTRSKYQRSGLGLSIVYSLVRNAGGAIEVVSQPGQGSCFRVFLPTLGGGVTSESKNEAPEAVRSE